MAIIYTYGFDDNVQDKDAWVGTNSGNRKTKQFSALSVANYMNRYGRISIGGQMSYKLVGSSPGFGEMSIIGGGDGTNFADIEFLNISTHDLSGAQVVEFLDYLTSTGILISRQNEPSVFGHYTVVAYTATIDPNVYKLELGILGSNGVVNTDMYYDLSPLNLAGGSGSGVNTIDTSEGSFITLTPTTPTAGNVLITADLSATGTPNATTFLRGDNTWAAAGEVDGNGTTNYVSKWADPSTLTDSVIYDDGANVGIGINNPAVELHVGGFARLNGGLQLNTANAQIYQIQNSDLRFGTNNTERMRITSTGNVGIGTTSPTDKLDVYGNIKLVQTNNYIKFANDFVTIKRDGSNNLSFSGYGGFKFYDTLAATERLRIDSSGNVGIGTTSPSAKLHVYSGLSGATVNTNADDFIIESNTNAGISILGDGNETQYLLFGDASNSAIGRLTYNHVDDSMGLFTNATERMRITSSGNVGIGTTAPLQKLHLNGGTDINLQIGAVSGELQIKTTNDADTAYTPMVLRASEYNILSGNVGIGTTSPQVKLETRGTASNTISSTTAVSKIVGNVGTGSVGLYSGSLAGSPNYGTWIQSMRETDNLAFQLLLNPNGGNVGIGTTSPSEKLHILGSGSGTTGRTRLQVENTNTTSAAAAIFKCGSNFASFQYSGPSYTIGEQFRVGTSADIPVAFSTNGSIPTGGTQGILFAPGGYSASPIMGVYPSSGGRVGIGTTSPSQKLHVNGSVRIADVIYDSSNSPGTAGQVLSKPTNDTIAWVNKDSITSIPTSITATPGGTLSLASNIDFVYFTWSGGSGTFDLNLPSAASNAYRIIRFVCDSTIAANDKIHVQGSLGDTVDGGLFYTLNKPYNGVQVWSDGSQWIVIQAKAT